MNSLLLSVGELGILEEIRRVSELLIFNNSTRYDFTKRPSWHLGLRYNNRVQDVHNLLGEFLVIKSVVTIS